MEIINSIASEAVKGAGKTIMKEVKMLYEVKEQVEEMKIELQWMQSFLEDADHRVSSQSQQRQSRVFRQWVLQVREASLDAEDIIDTYLVKLALRNKSGVVYFIIKRYVCCLKHAIDLHGVGSEIEAIKSKLSSLRLKLQTYGIIREVRVGDVGSSTLSGGYAKPLQSRSYGHIHDRNIVGLDKNIDEVVDLLLKKGEEACKVVSIYGMGGLGKTTLAKKVYHDKRVRTHFDKFAWVYVSQQFKARDVWESTLIELTSPSREEREEILKLKDSELVARLSQVQKDHKCVGVLDDIWSIEDWEKLSSGFSLEETGVSTILFTTRKKEVSEHANRRGSYGGLKCLEAPRDMDLLKKIAFDGRGCEIADKEREKLGRGMLKHCGGLPLAITVLGGILASKDSLSEWQTVYNNINAYLRRGKGHNEEQGLGVHQVLAYSYYDLPSPLKSCFLYLSQYPEEYEIETHNLMKMWIAEGFVSVEYDGEGEETVEDVAERYLNELVGRCVVQVGKTGITGRVKTCRLHDLMRDVCLSKDKEEGLIHSYERDAVTKGKIRRLSSIGVRSKNENISLSGYETYSHIRSLIICPSHRWEEYICLQGRFARRFKLLKMLLLEWVEIRPMKGLSKQIAELIHLRYLSLQGSLIYDWPSLDKLGCMETLDLRILKVESKVPLKIGEIWKMKQLRHLYLPFRTGPIWRYRLVMHIYPFDTVPRYSTEGDNTSIVSNSNLQTLVNFPPPNRKIGRILFKFPNLRKLKLRQGKHVVELWEILNNNKGFSFDRLRSFSLTSSFEGEAEKVDIEVVLITCPHLYKLKLDGPIKKFPQLNQFPTKLTKLVLRYSEIEDPKHIETTFGNLPNLRSLKLGEDSFKGEQLSFKKHTFPQLTTLSLGYLHELKKWTVEEGAMPNLERLEIYEVTMLEAIPQGLRFIVTLKELVITYMSAKFKARLEEGGADFNTLREEDEVAAALLSRNHN